MKNKLIPPHKSPKEQHCRQSGIELLRIICMFLVLLVHALYYSLGRPMASEYMENTVGMILRTELEAMCLVCVNVFVMISGWFGITFKLRGLSKFIYQWLFIAFFVVVLLSVCGKFYKLGEYKLLLGSYRGYWFVYAYILLYVFSPVLNAFVTNANRREFEMILGAYWAFMFLFGWIQPLDYIQYGLSPILFFGLYLSARYLHIYRPKWTLKSWKHDLIMYLSVTTVSAVLMEMIACFSSSIRLVEKSYGMFMSYVNPLTIVASLYLLLTFTKVNFYNKVVNKVAASAFAVYLVQCNFAIFDPIFKEIIVKIYRNYSGLMYPLFTTFFLVGIFVVSVLVDQLRIYSFNRLSKELNGFLPSKTYKV